MRSDRLHRSPSAVVWLAVLALVACDDDGAQSPADAEVPPWQGTVVLAAPGDWTVVEASADPFDDRPADVSCPAHGARDEDGHFEIETDICHYGTFVHPLPVDLRPGDSLEATVWHLDLWAAERSEGHAALMVGDRLVWEQRVVIPGQEAVYPIAVTLDFTAPAGSPLYFHVHNHGANSWRLLDVQGHRE